MALDDGNAGLCGNLTDNVTLSNLTTEDLTLSNNVCFGAESVKLLQTNASPEGGGSFLPPWNLP